MELFSRTTTAIAFGMITAFLTTTNAYALDYGSWDKKIPGQGRFVVLNAFDTEAVLDKETQLVWQRVVKTEDVSFLEARAACANATTGGRIGWRLPTNYEITSLVDPAEIDITMPPLPAGHPFKIAAPDAIFYATSEKGAPAGAWGWDAEDGFVTPKTPLYAQYWCVRGQ